jgi:hypothetical protein
MRENQKVKEKKHLMALTEVTVSNFTYHFSTQSPCNTMHLSYRSTSFCIPAEKKLFGCSRSQVCTTSFTSSLEVNLRLRNTSFISNTCSTQFKPFHPLINLSLTNGALSTLSQHMTMDFHWFHSFCPKKPHYVAVVLRWCNLAKEHPCFRPRCCHSTEGRALYCKWLKSSTGIVNNAPVTA